MQEIGPIILFDFPIALSEVILFVYISWSVSLYWNVSSKRVSKNHIFFNVVSPSPVIILCIWWAFT